MNALCYGVTVLIWGSTWLAIKGQLGTVDPTSSIFYRFALAAVLVLVWAVVRGLPMRYPVRIHVRFAAMGALMFSGNFVCFYIAEQTLSAALVSLVFAMSLVVNMVFARLFFGRTVTGRMVAGAVIGLVGVGTVFWPEFAGVSTASGTGMGLALSALGTVLFCLGNVVSAKTQAEGVPVVQATGYSMAYGALLLAPVLVVSDGPAFDVGVVYIGSLLYLAVFGSVIGFVAYLTLVGRIGGERAAYAMVLFPVVSVLLSTVFEDFLWNARVVAGVALILVGNAVILTGPAMARRVRDALRPPRPHPVGGP